jgi:hypothetical protein
MSSRVLPSLVMSETVCSFEVRLVIRPCGMNARRESPSPTRMPSGGQQTKSNRDQLSRQAEAIAARIRDARAAFMAGGGANVVPMLDRGSQSANEWLRSLKRVGAGAGRAHQRSKWMFS